MLLDFEVKDVGQLLGEFCRQDTLGTAVDGYEMKHGHSGYPRGPFRNEGRIS